MIYWNTLIQMVVILIKFNEIDTDVLDFDVINNENDYINSNIYEYNKALYQKIKMFKKEKDEAVISFLFLSFIFPFLFFFHGYLIYFNII